MDQKDLDNFEKIDVEKNSDENEHNAFKFRLITILKLAVPTVISSVI